MGLTFEIPKSLLEALRKRGLDPSNTVVDALFKMLNLDPAEEVETHVELAEKFLEEGRRLVEEDPIQASEKLYKAAEEAVKTVAIVLNFHMILERVKARDRWTLSDLDEAAKQASKSIGKEFYVGWDRAYYLHVAGFHEAKLNSEAVKERLPDIDNMVRVVKKLLEKFRQSGESL
ncbi:MAG: PaREP1 family protein [Candidatus Bathyarchaeia archaeon]